MPLEDLTPLGFEVIRAPAPSLPAMAMVAGYGQQWSLGPDDDEQALVDRATNHKTLYDKMTQAMQVFADNFTNWPTLTAQQKDAANRQAQRAIANMIRQARGDLSSGGV